MKNAYIALLALLGLPARLTLAQTCENQPSTISQVYTEYKLSSPAASYQSGYLNGSCSGPGGPSVAGTSMSCSASSVSMSCNVPTSADNDLGVSWSAARVTGGAYSVSTVCDGSGNACPVALLLHDNSSDAIMEYQNGAVDSGFSNCYGGCIGSGDFSACYQGCFTSFSCAFGGDYQGDDLTCPYTFVDVVTATCNNGTTGLIYDSELNCCCAAQMNAECGDYGYVLCNGDCSEDDDDDEGCEGDPGDGSNGAACVYDSDCNSENCDQYTCTCDGNTDSIMIDLTGAGYLLTSLAHGVGFDILANGKPEPLAWTSAGSDVGFLALDKNGNGKIDNGSELFTGLTSPVTAERSRRPLASESPAPAALSMKAAAAGSGARKRAKTAAAERKGGFAALAIYDEPSKGGNGDGQIDSQDAVYSKLLVWVDTNHDGISQPGELFTLAELGITSISLNIEPAKWTDAFGNIFTARTVVIRNGSALSAYDVGLVTGK